MKNKKYVSILLIFWQLMIVFCRDFPHHFESFIRFLKISTVTWWFLTRLVGEQVLVNTFVLIMERIQAWSAQVLRNRDFYTQNTNSHFSTTLFLPCVISNYLGNPLVVMSPQVPRRSPKTKGIALHGGIMGHFLSQKLPRTQDPKFSF